MKFFIIFLSILFPLLGTNTESSFSVIEIDKLSSAESVKDVFQIISETRLQTTEECPIAYITDMAVDSKGNFIIADGWQVQAVFVFSQEGTFIKQLGRKGQGPGEYINPVSVEVSQKGNIWIVDYGNNRICIFSRDMNYKNQIVCTSRILHYLHLNSRNEIYMYRSQANPLKPNTKDTIFRYDDQGNKIDSFAPFPKQALKVKFWAGQDGMTIGKHDFIYEMNPLYYNIRKYSPDGKLITSFSRKTNLFKVIMKEGKRPIIVYGPFYLEKGLLLAHVNEHLEIYDIKGNFIVGELPFKQRIISTHDNCLYTVVWEEGEKDQVQLNPKITAYQLR